MNTARFASALSTETHSDAAFQEVARAVKDELRGERPDLVATFVSHHHGAALEQLGQRLAEALQARVVIGCTGESIVGRDREIERGPALSVWAARLPNTSVRPFEVQVREEREDTYSFSSLPQVEDRARAGVVLFADPFSFPADDYLQILNSELPGVPAIGGMASGGSGPGQNLLITERGLLEGGAIGVVIEGDIELCPVVSQGCRPVGKPYVITSCAHNVLHKLGGKPAFQVLVETLKSLPGPDQRLFERGPYVGLALDAAKSVFERGDFLVRGIAAFDREHGTVSIGDHNIRNGMTIQFLVRDPATAGHDLEELVRSGCSRAGGNGALGALVFSCNGRGTRMFPRKDHDISCIQSAFPRNLPAAGFFAMGEIGPVGGRNFLHGFTASVGLFRSRS